MSNSVQEENDASEANIANVMQVCGTDRMLCAMKMTPTIIYVASSVEQAKVAEFEMFLFEQKQLNQYLAIFGVRKLSLHLLKIRRNQIEAGMPNLMLASALLLGVSYLTSFRICFLL